MLTNVILPSPYSYSYFSSEYNDFNMKFYQCIVQHTVQNAYRHMQSGKLVGVCPGRRASPKEGVTVLKEFCLIEFGIFANCVAQLCQLIHTDQILVISDPYLGFTWFWFFSLMLIWEG